MTTIVITPNDQNRFILWIPVLLGLGIGVYFALPSEPDIALTIMFCGILIIFLGIFWRKIYIRLIIIALLVTTVGMLRAEIRTQSVAAPVLSEEIFHRPLTARINDIQIKEKGEKLILSDVQIEGLAIDETPKYISVSLKEIKEELAIGDSIQLNATLFPPPTPVMPQAFDFARMFYYLQLGAVGYSSRPPAIIEKTNPNSFTQKLNGIRLSLTERILAPMSSENGWIAAAMMVGETSGVSKNSADILRASGIYHVLSISGLHLSLAAILVFVTTRFLLSLYPTLALRIPVKKIAAFIALISSFLYLLLAGYPVPAVRSFIMVACVMLAILCDRSGISIFSIAWAAMVILLWQPESLLGASFQLSFAATLAIIAFYERFNHILYRNNIGFLHKIWLYFLALMLTSLVATLATTPLVIYHFNRFTLWGIATNMLLLPLISFWIMPMAVIAFLLMPFTLEYYPLLALDYGISMMMDGARYFSSLPHASITTSAPSRTGIIIVILGGLWLCIWREKWRILGIFPIIIGMATIALHKPYDLLISPDASKVALRLADNNFLFLRGQYDSFDGQVWLRYHGQENGVDIKDMDKKLGSCDKYKCTISAYGKTIVTTKGKKEIEASCDDSPDIVISANYLQEVPECAAVPLLIDKTYLEEYGATALRFNNSNVRIENSRAFRGNRAWVD